MANETTGARSGPWHRGFQVGDQVEYLMPGDSWANGRVSRKTLSGKPVVSIPTTRGAIHMVADCKSDIRIRTKVSP